MLRQSYLLKLFKYDPNTGKIYWAVNKGSTAPIGREAGTTHHSGYRQIIIDGIKYRGHRIIWIYLNGDEDITSLEIDHIDGNRLNNIENNLRLVEGSENQKNKRLYRSNKSGYPGVGWVKALGKWYAEINVNGKNVVLGKFLEKDDAIAARITAERKYGYHKNHGS